MSIVFKFLVFLFRSTVSEEQLKEAFSEHGEVIAFKFFAWVFTDLISKQKIFFFVFLYGNACVNLQCLLLRSKYEFWAQLFKANDIVS